MASSTLLAATFAVSIHVGPDVPPELSAAAIESCDAALGHGQCRIHDASQGDGEWYASVSSGDGQMDRVRVELRRSEHDPVDAERNLAFSEQHAPRDRWASTGVMIAALIVAEERKKEEARVAASRETAPSPPPPAPAPVRRARPRSPPALRLDVRALLARRLERGAPELGGALGASFFPSRGPWLGGVSLAGARRPGDEPQVSWVSFGARGGARLGRVAEIGVGAVGEYWSLTASRAGRSEEEGSFRLGGTLAADAIWPVHRQWILSLGVEGRLVLPRFRVDVGGAAVERVPTYGALIFLGFGFMP